MTPQWLTKLKETITQLETETSKFYEKGNSSAGTRARKVLQEIKGICQEGRDDIQNTKTAEKK
jgi:endonuclease III-like uncharacterized protein